MAYWLIDQGNTRCKCRYVDDVALGAALGAEKVPESVVTRVVIDNAALRDGRIEESTVISALSQEASRVFIASVANQESYDALVAMLHGCNAALSGEAVQRVVTEPSAFGLTNAYEDCSRHGVDRWLALIAAYQQVRDAVVVIDCGTAITVDVANAKGEHEGGYIVPSEPLMAENLQMRTGDIRLLHDVDLNDALSFGRSTEDCVYRGLAVMSQAFLREILRWAQQRDYRVFVTGGGAVHYSALWADAAVTLAPDLVIEGLACYAQ